MAIFKCKMCGGTIEFQPGDSVGVCDSCGTRQTLPRLDDDRRANLYDRANHFRRSNEFDKAAGLYEQILNEDPSDAESYWSLVLCRYGIEYVEDPVTHKRVPTVNRAQYTSIFDDADYKSALEHADGHQRAIYEEEASAINEIQKGILAISQKEKPFDVFICYKESDASGRRTQDSVLANDLYYQLKNEGFKVFFSRITLEDKLGTAYEPYIFAALNSAKVMVVLGTRPEYFNAVWVKNEWSRFLALVKQSAGKKILIPAYRDMDPYDLPEEFSHLQAQDMSKLGFMQDLIRGIKKITGADEPKVTRNETISTGSSMNVEPLLERVFMFLEDGEWTRADDCCEQVLNQDPKNAKAYLGKLMAELHIGRQEELANCEQPFDSNNNYQKAVRFGDEQFSGMLSGYIEQINERNENARLTAVYDKAVSQMKAASSETSNKAAASTFQTISGFKDADALAEQCLERAEICSKNAIYDAAIKQMQGDDKQISNYETAIRQFRSIPGWRDADENIDICQRKIEELKARKEEERLALEQLIEKKRIADRKRKKMMRMAAAIIVLVFVFSNLITKVIIPNGKYNAAVTLYNAGKYDEAISAFADLDGYKDSETQIEKCCLGKYGEKEYKRIKNIKVGSILRFGSYEQDNNTSNGKEEIEWIVLANEGYRLLLTSKYGLDAQPYNTDCEDVTWETCTLRKWLNDTFQKAAFTEKEKNQILKTKVKAEKNPAFSTKTGNNTEDKVFLLNIQEAEKYFESYDERELEPTRYAIAKGAWTSDEDDYYGNGWWWLRSPGNLGDSAAFVYNDGVVGGRGDSVDVDRGLVRPALWITL